MGCVRQRLRVKIDRNPRNAVYRTLGESWDSLGKRKPNFNMYYSINYLKATQYWYHNRFAASSSPDLNGSRLPL